MADKKSKSPLLWILGAIALLGFGCLGCSVLGVGGFFAYRASQPEVYGRWRLVREGDMKMEPLAVFDFGGGGKARFEPPAPFEPIHFLYRVEGTNLIIDLNPRDQRGFILAKANNTRVPYVLKGNTLTLSPPHWQQLVLERL